VPLKGQDSSRAECRNCSKNQRLPDSLKWLVACSVRVEFSSVLTESDLFVDLVHLPEKALFNVRKGSRDQKTPNLAKGSFMAVLLAILDFLFGCQHVHLSRVFTLQGETYRVCCDCGAKFAYSLKTMSIEHRLPLTPALTRFRVA
jgi:hypothetical protein